MTDIDWIKNKSNIFTRRRTSRRDYERYKLKNPQLTYLQESGLRVKKAKTELIQSIRSAIKKLFK